ncbi:unnamed protein product, partial [Didymodactylos carnosus]
YELPDLCRTLTIHKLYNCVIGNLHEVTNRLVSLLNPKREIPTRRNDLNEKYSKWIGPFMQSIDNSDETTYSILVPCNINVNEQFACLLEPTKFLYPMKESKNGQQEILRDLLLWSLFMYRLDLAKVFILHLKSRICAALIASKILKMFSKKTTIDLQLREQLSRESDEFDLIATKFINSCYEYKEDLACELLLRPVPLFGNVTCTQIAIANENKLFLQTSCFDRTLNRIWYDKLSLTNRSILSKPGVLISELTFGLTVSVPKLIRFVYIQDNLEENREAEYVKLYDNLS